MECVPSGVAWSVDAPVNNCGSGTPTYLDGGPDGSFCCANEPDAGTAAADATTDAGDAADAGE